MKIMVSVIVGVVILMAPLVLAVLFLSDAWVLAALLFCIFSPQVALLYFVGKLFSSE